MLSETVDLLFVYDNYTLQRFNGSPDTALINWVDQANNYYQNSQVDLEIRIVGIVNYNITGSDSGDVLDRSRTNSWINEQRNLVGADFVSVIHESGNCGVGYLAVHQAWAYNVVGADCGSGWVLAHELGHNMGLNHSRAQGDERGARYRYGLGHGETNLFGTIMTYYWIYGGRSAAVFSNPRINCYNVPCGVPEGQPDEADGAKALNNVKTEIAGFRRAVSSSSSSSSSTSSSSSSSSSSGGLNNLALVATASTSYVSSWETLDAVNDGSTPTNSNDKSAGAYGNWNNPNSIQWVQYDWVEPVVLSSTEVYWFDDNGGVLVPTVAYIDYWSGSEWQRAGDVPLAENTFNSLALSGISTTRLRVSMLNSQQSTGILEWRVYGQTDDNGNQTNTILIQENTNGFCNVQGTVDSNHAGFTGAGFANTINANGNGIEWAINGDAGTYTISWRYANGSTTNRIAELSTNNSAIDLVDFSDTGAWSAWSTSSATVSLPAGQKTLRLSATLDQGLANIDSIDIMGPGVAAGVCQ